METLYEYKGDTYVKARTGRPPKTEAERKGKNRLAIYVSDNTLSTLGVTRFQLRKYLDDYVEELLKVTKEASDD